MQLQSILMPRKEICEEESLYFHRVRHTVRFDGYFNLFYIEKRKHYKSLTSLSLHFRASGYRCIHLMHDREEIAAHPLNPAVSAEYRFVYPYAESNGGVFWFSLEEDPE